MEGDPHEKNDVVPAIGGPAPAHRLRAAGGPGRPDGAGAGCAAERPGRPGQKSRQLFPNDLYPPGCGRFSDPGPGELPAGPEQRGCGPDSGADGGGVRRLRPVLHHAGPGGYPLLPGSVRFVLSGGVRLLHRPKRPGGPGAGDVLPRPGGQPAAAELEPISARAFSTAIPARAFGTRSLWT